jgi:hypothetical protein
MNANPLKETSPVVFFLKNGYDTRKPDRSVADEIWQGRRRDAKHG